MQPGNPEAEGETSQAREAEQAEPHRPAREPGLEAVIDRLSVEHGFDVRGYKRTTLYRRLRKRMQELGCPAAEDYLLLLETDRHEHVELINTILINVTGFFRDPEAWQFLQEQCLPRQVRRRSAGEPIRVWSVGCATGEEAFSVAMALAEVMEQRSLRDLKIYATDLDEDALSKARAGTYSQSELKNLSQERLDRYFDQLPSGRYQVRRELRSTVIFGKHNALSDPPISRLDLIVCRNLMIYFDIGTQQQLLARLHYALRDEGYLFLGKAETLMTRSLLFRPVEPRFRIFQRVPQQGLAEDLLGSMQVRRRLRDSPDAMDRLQAQNYMLQALVEEAINPLLLLDAAGRIQMASPLGREQFHLTDAMMGRSFLELDERFRPVNLRLAVEETRATGRPSRLEELRIERGDGAASHLRMDVRPILDPTGTVSHIVLWGQDLTREHSMAETMGALRQELQTTTEELQTTAEELQTTNEELETTNEELQSTNEELETTNEELQSTNEELETTIEELQSTNEELETTNDELRARQQELNLLSRHQERVLSSLQMGLVVLDERLRVTSWNHACETTWGLREEEVVGQVLYSLDIGLPVETLREPLAHVLAGQTPREVVERDATNRRGRPVRCRMVLTPILDGALPPVGAVMIVEVKEA
jgi:two-component system, chemotaxis family, CheB/CheR fusion protein